MEGVNKEKLPAALTIAGSDPSGGAGIQADLKVFNSLGVYGMSALTCLTAGNTTGVKEVEFIDPQLITSQINSILEDIPPKAIKTGMLGNGEIIRLTADALKPLEVLKVIDPVMKTKRGDILLSDRDIGVFVDTMLPFADLLTPNIPEATLISGSDIRTESDMEDAAKKIVEMGCRSVLIKGGYFDEWNHSNDLFYDGIHLKWIHTKRIETTETHGAGDVLSAAITAYLAKGVTLSESVENAKKYVKLALETAPGLGRGEGPLNLIL